ncbi:hypothetical protein [Brevibacillus sp. MER 51]|uniref:hypothetical protein n=1 Tax=Brevibacillus sp. MER 51 TaxID=2939560 RepID=UPI00203C929B|nr:hypothetical protein [Brevibacillus sp. MER 51]MCM3143029.1 hypothetical protein [Brevibacillus sp. MER 51]
MIYIQIEKETEAQAFVTFIHYNPLDPTEGLGKTQEELLRTGLLIEGLPAVERKAGKDAKLYFNPQTKELWYEYVDDVPSPLEDRLKKVENDISENKQANLDTQEAVLQLYEMVSQPQPK